MEQRLSFDKIRELVAAETTNALAAGRAGLGIAALGGVCLLIRAGVLFYGKSQIRKAVNLYNNGALYSQNAIEMQYGFSGNGIFLTLSF